MGRRRVLASDQLGVDVAVQLAIQVVIALVLQGAATRRTLETLHVQVLVLDAHEHSAANTRDCYILDKSSCGEKIVASISIHLI